MSYKSERFRAQQFNEIASIIERYIERKKILDEYGVTMKLDDSSLMIEAIISEVKKPEPQSASYDGGFDK
jgi:hypothetical protein